MGFSLTVTLIAALGYLTPTIGAVLQEGIDVAAILNALRAVEPGRDRWPRLRGDEAELVRHLDEKRRSLWPGIERLPAIADAIAQQQPSGRDETLAELSAFLTDLTVHERKDERLLYPAVAGVLGGAAPRPHGTRTHRIAELTRRITLLTDELSEEPTLPTTRQELRRAIETL
jgi:hypothetical protein